MYFKLSVMGLCVVPGDGRHIVVLLWSDVCFPNGNGETKLEASENRKFFMLPDSHSWF